MATVEIPAGKEEVAVQVARDRDRRAEANDAGHEPAGDREPDQSGVGESQPARHGHPPLKRGKDQRCRGGGEHEDELDGEEPVAGMGGGR